MSIPSQILTTQYAFQPRNGKFNPQITQINADFRAVADECRVTRQAGRKFKIACCLIGENLRNLRTAAFCRFSTS
jgi:hypothetical protein